MYNPEFIRQVHEKRRRQEAERLAREMVRQQVERLALEKDRQKRAETEQKERLTLIRLKAKSEERFSALMTRLGAPAASSSMRVTDIIALVAAKHGVMPGDIRGPSRNRRIVAARWDAIAQVRRMRPDLSLPVIGRMFGGRDHTTISHALRQMGMQTASRRDAA